MQEGDINTKFFHRKAVARAKKICVKRLRKEDGQTIEDKSKMAQMVTNFFKTLYTTDNRVTPEGVTELFQEKI
jgi:predicted acetyltransferase